MLLLYWLCLLSTGLAQVAFASPLRDPGICGQPTCAPWSKFSYQMETDYVYKYTTNVSTAFYGTNTNASTLRIDSQVSLKFLSPCEAIMQLDKTQLFESATVDGQALKVNTESPNSTNFANAVHEFPLRFSFQDGLLEEICPESDELSWVLNFKRGILSAFQTTMTRFDVDHTSVETDVNGDCETSYSLISPRDTSLILKKTKKMSSCTNRYKQRSIIQSTPYVFQSKYKSVPLMGSSSECELVVDHNVYSEITCEESHLFQPFSSHNRGAKTTTTQRLLLIEENNSTTPLPEQISRRSTLRFDHRQTPKPTTAELSSSRDHIKSLCRLNADDVEEGFSYVFKKFIQTARVLTFQALTKLYDRAPSLCSSGRKHVKSALPLLGTNAAISVMRDVILKNELSESEVKDWLFAIALTPLPDVNTVAAVVPLLNYEKYSVEAILTVSAVVHSYVRVHRDSELQEPVLEVVHHLEKIAHTGCRNKRKIEEQDTKVLIALKATGNMGISTPTLNQTLQICIENEMLHMDSRIAAIEAHRRLPCNLDRNYLSQLFKDSSADSELRIAAYLEVMRCPTYKIIRSIKDMLKNEEVNQVGSFIMSHLNNLQKSSIPSRVEIQGLLTDVHLQTKFSADVRKFSQYFEKSLFHDEYNVGGNIEGSLVFSPKSYMPRSTSLNLTLDLFGESINMLEMTARAEGFEHYIESVFGPNGTFSNKKVNDIIQNIRYRRNSAQNLQQQVDDMKEQVFNSQLQPKASLGLKIFGNELKYFNFLGDTQVKKLAQTLNPMEALKSLLSEKEINYEKSTMFLDSSYVIPTGTGLPITLNAVGTAAINFKTTGSFKASDFLNTGELDVEGHIRPSVAVDVMGSMAVDAYYTETKIKLKTNVYSSAAIQCQVKIRGTKLISASFSLPKDRTEIFSAKSELLVRKDGQDELQDGIRKARSHGNLCTWPPIEQMLGLRLCLDYQFPNTSKVVDAPAFFLTGPIGFNAYVKKTDPSVLKYLMEFMWNSTQNSSVLSFMFDTPGSRTPRQFSTRLRINSHNETSIQLALHTSDTKWEAHGQYLNTPSDKHIRFGLLMNGKKQLTAELGVLREEAKNGFIFSPRLYLAYNSTDVAKLAGALRKEEKKGIAQWHVNLKINVLTVSTNITGYVKRTDTSLSANLTTSYQIKTAKPERVRIDFELKQKTGKAMEQRQGDIRIECTAYPYFNINGSAKYMRLQTAADFKLDLSGSPEDENNWTVSLAYTDSKSHDASKFLSSIEIIKPSKKIDFKLALDYHIKGTEMDYSARLRYAQGKEIYTSLYIKDPPGIFKLIEGKLNISLPSFTPMIINGTLHEKIPNEFDVELSITWFSGLKFLLKGLYQDKSTIKLSNYILKLVLSSESFEEISFIAKYHCDNTELRIDLQASQNTDLYTIVFKHGTPTVDSFETFIELKYKSRVYSAMVIATLQEEKHIKLDLHLDKFRDISVSFGGINLQRKKRLEFDIKWDVNRDPGQKLNFGINFENPVAKNYSMNALLSYPGRTVKCAFNGAVNGLNYITFIHFEWSPDDVIEVTSNFLREKMRNGGEFITLKSELITPFPNWKRTTFNTDLRMLNNVFQAESNVHWQKDQNIRLNLFGTYEKNANYLYCQCNGTLLSSINGIPSMSTNIKHNQTDSTFTTDVHLQKGPEQLVLIKSDWKIDRNEELTDLSGRIDMISPFRGYENGTLIGKILIEGDAEIHGVADLKLQDRNYRIDIDGHIQSFTENMLILNITTPVPKISTFTARFGYSEMNHHFVAELKGPTRALGIEILLNLKSVKEFDIILNLATPFELLQKISVEGKSRSDYINLQAALNNYNVGLSGMWFYENLTNFEYNFQIYTPLPGYERSGVITKLRKNNDSLDFEASIKIADAKLGVKVEGATAAPTSLPPLTPPFEEDEEVEEEEEEDSGSEEEIPFYWSGRIEIDSIMYPQIKGTLHIEEINSVYDAALSLTLPEGTVEVKDQLEVTDFFNMQNKLVLKTPWESFQEVHSNYKFLLNMEEENYVIENNLKYKNKQEWIDLGLIVGYNRVFNSKKASDIRSAVLHVHTPFEMLQLVHLNASLERGINMYRANFSGNAGENEAKVQFYLKAEEGFIDFMSNINISTKYFYIPPFKINYLQDMTNIEKKIGLTLDLYKPGLLRYTGEVMWHYEPQTYLNVKLRLQTPIEKLKKLIADVLIKRANDSPGYTYTMQVIYNDKTEYKMNGLLNFETQKLEINFVSTLESIGVIRMVADYNDTQPGTKAFALQVHHNAKAYLFEGSIKNTTENSYEIYAKFISGPKNTKDLLLELTFNVLKVDDGYNMTTYLNYNTERVVVHTQYKNENQHNINVAIDVKTTLPGHSAYTLNANLLRHASGNVSVDLAIVTPIKNYESINLGGFFFLTGEKGSFKVIYSLGATTGVINVNYIWLISENMQINANILLDSEKIKKYIIANVFYMNKNKAFEEISTGFEVNQNNREWQLGTNVTLSIADFLQGEVTVSLPQPYKEVYKVSGRMKKPFLLSDWLLTLAYDTEEARTQYGLHIECKHNEKSTFGVLQVNFNKEETPQVYRNVLDVKSSRKNTDIFYKLKTPYFTEETLTLKVNYGTTKNNYFIIRSAAHYPESSFAAGLNADYLSVSNMNGTLNSTTPIQGLPYAGVTVQVISQDDQLKRYLKLFWTNNTAIISSDAKYDTSLPDSQVNGTLIIEIPVSSRHIGVIDYQYFMEDPETRIGHTLVQYNQRNVLEANLRSHGTIERGLEKENIYLEIENQMAPIGVRYNHVLQYNPDTPGDTLPKREIQRAELFKLRNASSFNLTGELEVHTTKTGKEIKITAHNPNRTVHLATEYNILNKILHHKSILRVDPQTWLAYDLRVENKTVSTEMAEKHLEFNVQYPKRNITLTGFYKLSALKLTSQMFLNWDKDKKEKTIGAGLEWQKLSSNPSKQLSSLSLQHPSLQQDVKLSCELYRDQKKMIESKIDLVYSTDEDKRLTIFAELLNETHMADKVYKVIMGAQHPATSLDLKVEGNVQTDSNTYQTYNFARYKRSYLPLKTGEVNAKLQLAEKMLQMESKTQKERQFFKGWYEVNPPLYTASFNAIPGNNQNSTGNFIINIKEYETALDINSTQDGTDKNLYMRGNIPDARNSVFKVWRDYDGVLIPDVSFYLRLNHSRLITSKFVWRAELPDQLVSGYHELSNAAWEGAYGTIDYWKQYIKSESIDAVHDIWQDAQPIVEDVLADLSDIKDIENDALLLCTYLNRSYHDNQFYIKNIVGLGVLLIDELSLRRHLENLPEVVNELWAVMGESGESLRKSLIWVIETLKSTFEKAVEVLNNVMKGETSVQFSNMFDNLMASYDKFVKDLHLSFTIRIEEFWKTMSDNMRYYWGMVEQLIAPTFVKLLHYAETAVWRAGDEILDFFYEKKKEIQESPHYNKFSIFLHDLDVFYKDFTRNDAITNIQKYSAVVFEFIREKYFAVVPFGKELQDLMDDLVRELKELKKLSSVSFVLQKLNEAYEKIDWIYKSFDVESKLRELIAFAHFKVHEITQTALDAENNNREAKTKFIFEPELGTVELEQKLPISWHSFNERPNYEEIPEYKALLDLQNYFVASNKSLWHYYNEYKPYTDPSNWLPPFQAQAMIAGNQHFITFDHKLYAFRGSCSYLLANDFLDTNVTLIVSYEANSKYEFHKVLIVLGNNVIKVDLFADSVELNNKPQTRLPFMIGDTYVYQKNKVVYVESERGYSIYCNLEFDICTVQLSGWYFGKTAGLLGTIDNEHTTDFKASNGSIVNDINQFAQSWALNVPLCKSRENLMVPLKQPDSKIISKCDAFFSSRESEFQPCFSVVDPEPYKEMCLTSRIYKEFEACTAAMAYIKACQWENTPVKLPPDCVRCRVKDEELTEGDYVETIFGEAGDLTSSDVVFLIEAKECNRDLKSTRHMGQLLTILSNELEDANITKSRLGVVVFGGDGVFDEPRSIVLNNEFSDLFTPLLFDNIPVGNGSNDIFEALRFASKLNFRPGVSKTFILMPCTACNPDDMSLDYPAVHQMLLENDITLHILMDDEFSFNKTKVKKLLFGVDGSTAYTKKDIKELKGDADLFRQVAMPKHVLGFCVPLAIETNGTLFSAKKLETDKPRGSKNFATVFTKRVAQTARPSTCQNCECAVDHHGVSSVFCSPCVYPMPSHGNPDQLMEFNEDALLSHLQPKYEDFKHNIKPMLGL